MGRKSGDKGRYHRKRRQKIARREDMRALRKQSQGESSEKQSEEKAASGA